MKTGPGTHRHQDSRGKWTIQVDPPHVHDLDLSTITPAELDVLRVRLGGIATPATVRAAIDAGRAAEMVKLTRTYAAASGTSVTVSSIVALKAAALVNANTDIVLTNGTYVASGAPSQLATSLWFDEAYAARTNPLIVRAETPGGVTISGGGATSWNGLMFNSGVHDMDFRGFRFANATMNDSGVIVFGGYDGLVAPYNITLRDTWLESTLLSGTVGDNDHGVYFAHALSPGPNNILVDGLNVVSNAGGLDSAIHFFHNAVGNPNSWNVTVRNMTVTGTSQAVMLWDSTLHDVTIEDSTITGARSYAIRYQNGNASSAIIIRRVNSTSSGSAGFYSSNGANPPGITFIDSVLN